MNYNKKRMIVALHLTVSSVMLLSGFTSPGTKMNTAGDLRYAGGEIAVQIGDSVVDGTISMIKGTKQVSQSVQTAGDVWKTEAVRIEEMIRAEEERAAEEARIAEEQAAQAAADALAGSNPIGDCLSFGNGNWGLQIGDHFFH